MAVLRVPADFERIQDAVDAAAPGDTIRVAGGIYAEAVRIGAEKDRLTLMGSGPGNSILRGTGGGVGFWIEGSSAVTIAGFRVAGFATGIRVATNDNVIRNVMVTDCTTQGIDVENGAFRNLFLNIVSSSHPRDGLSSSGPAVYVLNSEFFHNVQQGINVFGFRPVVIGNRAWNNDVGLEGSNTNAAVFVGNHLIGNAAGLTGEAEVAFRNAIRRNQRAGVELIFSGASLLLENEVRCNLGQGLFLAVAGLARLLFNDVENNGLQGIDLNPESTPNVIDDNQIAENGAAGIWLDARTADNAFRRNKLAGNNPDIGAPPPASTNNVFDENQCKRSEPPGLCPCDP